ncbi:MAG: hypothetical protein WCV81_03255 [Microgenomates group bacterium]|jgi:hypothetical protein
MTRSPDYEPYYRPTTNRTSLNFTERAANHLIASIVYGGFFITRPDALFKNTPREIAKGYQRFYNNMDHIGLLPYRPLVGCIKTIH